MIRSLISSLGARAHTAGSRLALERGATLVEYALMVALIAVVCIGAVTAVGTASEDKFDESSAALGALPRSTEDLGGDCSGGACHFWVPDRDPNNTYAWMLPDGTTLADPGPGVTWVPAGETEPVVAYMREKDRDGVIIRESRIRCDMNSDAVYECA